MSLPCANQTLLSVVPPLELNFLAIIDWGLLLWGGFIKKSIAILSERFKNQEKQTNWPERWLWGYGCQDSRG